MLYVEKTPLKKNYNPWANKKFQKMLKNFNITLVPINKCNIKNLINTNYKDDHH